ncbi:MAG: hypothetical protein FJ276_17210 [Planctomycetes bacterium]|nr:hypothetical protein [Planctomycetota bacterium]
MAASIAWWFVRITPMWAWCRVTAARGALRPRRYQTTVIPFLMFAVLCGCGKTHDVDVVPVTGKVFFGQQPAGGAVIVLHPSEVDPAIVWTHGYPHGVALDDGTFQLSAPPFGEGVPLGKYVVTITWPDRVPGADAEEDGDPEAVDRLEGRWADPAQSRLTAVVEGPETSLPQIQLR